MPPCLSTSTASGVRLCLLRRLLHRTKRALPAAHTHARREHPCRTHAQALASTQRLPACMCLRLAREPGACRGIPHLEPACAIASYCSASLASCILRCFCCSLRCCCCDIFLPLPAAWESARCAPLAASAEGSSTALRRPAASPDSSVLGRLPSPRDVLASPLLLPATAATLLDSPPPPPPA
jgi:hypothetical protein